MTLSTIGAHMTENGIGSGYPSRVCLSIAGNGLGEQHPDTIRVFRDITVYNDGPPDLHTHPQRRSIEFAQYWYDRLRPIWQANANRADYFTITNELGGSDPEHILDHIAYEANICQLAQADGLKCAVGKLAGDTPDLNTNLWEELYAPHIVDMWNQYGAIYARHVYGGDLVDGNGAPTDDPPGNPQRAILEAAHLRSLGYGGGMVLAECGLDGGYGVADYGRFRAQVLGYADALKQYADIIIGLCFWEAGTSGFEADYTEHLKMLRPYLDTSLPKWEGKESEDMEPKDCTLFMDLGRFIHLIPQDTTGDEIAAIAREFNARGEGVVKSHDDAELIVAHGRGQNSEGKKVSEVRIWEPQRFTFDVVGYFASRGYKSSVGYFSGQPPAAFAFTHWPTPHKVVTQRFMNNPNYYAQFDLPGHEGVDIRANTGDPLYAVADGNVSQKHDSATGSNYGRYIRIAHVDGYETTYAHCQSLEPLAVGAVVRGGQLIARADNTGNSSGSHLHLTLKKRPSNPPDRCGTAWPYNIIDPEPYLSAFSGVQWPSAAVPCDHPPPAQTVDTLRYFVPSNQYGRKIVMRVGSGTQPMQLEKRANDVILRKGDGNWIGGIKYQDSEQWKVVNGQVQKGKDTSAGTNGGKDAYDLNWAQWIPQHVEVGKTYHSTPTVRRFDRTTCVTISSTPANDYLYIKALVPSWTSPANASIVLQNVLIIEWRSGTPDLSVPPTETYYFAKEIAYVGWGSHFINEIADGQAPLTGKLDCGQ